MGRAPCCEKEKVKRGAWSPEEDSILVEYISRNGHGSWRSLPKLAGLERCGKSCRLRWENYLRPDIKRGPFTYGEETIIIQLHGLFGNKWAAIAAQLQGRTDNEVKNYWNSHLKKRFELATRNIKSIDLKSESQSTSHMVQWESARVEAEARLSSMASRHKSMLHGTNCDQFLKIWNSNIGQSFSKASSGSATDVMISTKMINTIKKEDSIEYCGQGDVDEEMVVGPDYSDSCELDDCSDSALKYWVDFLSGSDMNFLERPTDDDLTMFFQGCRTSYIVSHIRSAYDLY